MIMSFFPWMLYALAWLGAFFFSLHNGQNFWESLLFFVVILNGGFQGIWAAIGHLCFPKQSAAIIGWQPSGFQTEIGGTNLAIGLVSFACIWHHAWVSPVGWIISIFFTVCAYTHLKERFAAGNAAPCNSGPMLYSTIILVITLLVLLMH